jgi:hypothetical protein
VTVVGSTAGFIIKSGVAANIFSGVVTLERHGTVTGSHYWVASHSLKSSATVLSMGGGHHTGGMDSPGLVTVRLTRTGTDTFDLGQVSANYER